MNQEIYDRKSKVDERVDRFVAYFGSLKFIAWMTVVIVCWVTFNTLNLTGTLHFDKYPFILLNLIFSTQASYAAPLILLSQNRAAERDRLKAEHDYRVNLESLQHIQTIKKHLGLSADVHSNQWHEGDG